MMKTERILSLALSGILCLTAAAQTDSTTIDRTVTVEREFKPVIQSAGKLSVKPEVYEPKLTPMEVNYSDYSEPAQTDYSLYPLGWSETTFTQPRPMKGFVRGGFGHTATQLDFYYTMTERRNLQLDLHASHLGQWGRKTLARSALGLDLTKRFGSGEFYFGVDAANIYLTRYGRYFQYTDLQRMQGEFKNLDSYSRFSAEDKNAQWEIDTRIGVRSLPGAELQYKVQTGYEAFVAKANTVEHTIHTEGMFEWQREEHHVGANLLVENHLYSFDRAAFETFYLTHDKTMRSLDSTAYHAVKLEPYYAYEGRRFRIHAGVNLDVCAGKGKVFLPSPKVDFEAKLTKDWLALYGGAVGQYATSSTREHFGYLRYLHAENEFTTLYNRTYTPVQAFLGFKLRPQRTLLVDIYARYRYTKYDVFFRPEAVGGQQTGYFNLVSKPYQQWQIGARFSYHYQDIVSIALNGFYNIWKMDDYASFNLPVNHILDRPTWGINFRVDGKIDSKWSLYSDNQFGGGRYALDYSGQAVALKPTIDLNLGVQYNVNRWLACYFQLNNYLHRKHDVFYGYQSQGINFMLGVSYTF